MRTVHRARPASPAAREASTTYRIAVTLLRPPLMALTRRRWSGAEHLPRAGGFVVCSNHISHIDPLILTHFLHDNGFAPRFLAKESVFGVPVVGPIVRGAHQIPVRRESLDAGRALTEAVDAVRAGACVIIYPEATLTRDPQLWPMVGKSGATRLALATGCPVVPVAQWGAQRMLPPYAHRPRLWPPTQVQVRAGAPVDLSRFAGLPIERQVLRQATEVIMTAITGLLEQVRQAPAPDRRWDPREHGQTTIGRIGPARPGSQETG